jgi:hypothetical protein
MALPFFNTTGLFVLATDTQLSGLFGVMSIIFGILDTDKADDTPTTIWRFILY